MIPMDIVHFVENLERGGLERTVIDLIAAQREAGHRCAVICLFQEGMLAAELREQGVVVQACGKRRGPDMQALLKARRFIADIPGAVLHTHNSMAHYYAVLATMGLPVARIINTRHSMGGRKGTTRQEWLYRHSMRSTDHVVAVCDAERKRLQANGVRPRCELSTIPNGISLERFVPATPERRRALAEGLGWHPDGRIIGTVGRLQPVKDQARLIRAFDRVRSEVPSAVLAIVGDGGLRPQLERLVEELGLQDCVRFLGDRGDVPQLLSGMELFALSSLSEGYSVALIEACAAALPIVATDVGGNHEIVRDGINGKLVAAGDTSALANALLGMLANADAMLAMGKAGRGWALSEASFRTMAGRYERLYAGAAHGMIGKSPEAA